MTARLHRSALSFRNFSRACLISHRRSFVTSPIGSDFHFTRADRDVGHDAAMDDRTIQTGRRGSDAAVLKRLSES